MLRKRLTPRWITLAIGLLAAAIFAGGVIAAQFRDATNIDGLEASFRDDPLVKVADIAAEPGLSSRGVFVQSTSAGFLCLWDAPSAGALNRQGGCNSSDDPLGGKKMFVSLAYEGGPAMSDVKDARLIGLTASDVANVQLLMTDGTRRELRLKKASVGSADYGALGYRLRKVDLRRGVGPTAVIALNDAGEEIDRQATGFAQ